MRVDNMIAGSGRRSDVEPLIFDMSVPGRIGYSLPEFDVPSVDAAQDISSELLRDDNALPEVSEPDVVRHFVRLSEKNFSIDTGFYPLGSCTMKYNPKVNEVIGRMSGFSRIHPEQPAESVQGALELMFELEQMLAEIGGMDAVTLQPAAGAHGELTGILMIRAYHEKRGEGDTRRVVLVPDSAHGTNPATAARAGYQVVKIPSNACGTLDIEALKGMLGDNVAAVMLTNPNTLGLYESQVIEISDLVHSAGAQMYCDGANMNAIMGISRPGDVGFDVMHLNLHKTFSGPHGGGGPGSGPVGCKNHLAPFLPVPVVRKSDYGYSYDYDLPESIGKIHGFHGNFGVMVRAYHYIRSLGPDGLRHVSETAILNANYLLSRLKDVYPVPYGEICMHEFVASAKEYKRQGVKALDIAKRLMDFGFHPPTIYFPLIVEEALMIEPTETESRQTLDAFIEVMLEIARESKEDPESVRSAPQSTVISRADETLAARRPDLKWTGD